MATQGRRRAFGQHFLKDQSISHEIAQTAVDQALKHQCKALLEIGPGQGAITEPLLERIQGTLLSDQFCIVERDPRIAQFWIEKLRGSATRLELGDFLEVTQEKWMRQKPLAVVSNLPYSAGTAILVRLAREFVHIPVMVLMFQAEVAKRLMAGPSESGRGSLSVWIQNVWDVTSLRHVPPKAFSPPPQVDSEVVILTRRALPHIAVFESPVHEKKWESLLKACFAHRRKMLRSTFPWPEVLKASGVDPTLRAEALDWPQWEKLFQNSMDLLKNG